MRLSFAPSYFLYFCSALILMVSWVVYAGGGKADSSRSPFGPPPPEGKTIQNLENSPAVIKRIQLNGASTDVHLQVDAKGDYVSIDPEMGYLNGAKYRRHRRGSVSIDQGLFPDFNNLDDQSQKIALTLISHPDEKAVKEILEKIKEENFQIIIKALPSIARETRQIILFDRYRNIVPEEYKIITAKDLNDISDNEGLLGALHQFINKKNPHYLVHITVDGVVFLGYYGSGGFKQYLSCQLDLPGSDSHYRRVLSSCCVWASCS